MTLKVFSGRANPPLADAIARAMGTRLGQCQVQSFPDDELKICIEEDVLGADVCVVQPTSPPVGRHLLELLLLADAARRSGAARITAVTPYWGYARQDRRSALGEPLGARLLADLMKTRLDRLVTVDLHNPAVEGSFSFPTEHLSSVTLLADTLRPLLQQHHVVVAPDLGAVKLAQRYADLLDLPVAYLHKERMSGSDVRVRRVIGAVKGCHPILIDDMISTGGTMVSAIQTLLDKGCQPPVTVVVSHALLVGKAVERLARLPVGRLVATDSVPWSIHGAFEAVRVPLGDMLAEVIGRMHERFVAPSGR